MIRARPVNPCLAKKKTHIFFYPKSIPQVANNENVQVEKILMKKNLSSSLYDMKNSVMFAWKNESKKIHIHISQWDNMEMKWWSACLFV